jgi:hypothetical protein
VFFEFKSAEITLCHQLGRKPFRKTPGHILNLILLKLLHCNYSKFRIHGIFLRAKSESHKFNFSLPFIWTALGQNSVQIEINLEFICKITREVLPISRNFKSSLTRVMHQRSLTRNMCLFGTLRLILGSKGNCFHST